ncbi:hypothetical protein JL720_16699 [Aureococcus anophagefferens]|nr:hypothetical protein JL720_16699 [Aureococcus anophagefferens]
MFLIIFVFENLRSLILLIYLPALLVPKLRHIRDPLHVPLVPFRHETPVTPVQLVGVREARCSRRPRCRGGSTRAWGPCAASGLFVSTDDPTDVPAGVLARRGGPVGAVRDRLFGGDDELIVDADHDDRDVNRDFRRGHAAGWSLDNVRERLGYVNWERRGSARPARRDGFVMRLHQEFQELFLEETANLLTIIVASVSGEVFDVFRRGAAPRRRRGAAARPDVDLVPRRDDYDSDDDDLAENAGALRRAFQQNIHVRFDRESSLASRPGDGDDDAGDGAAPTTTTTTPDADVAPAASTAPARPWTRSRPTRRSAARRTRGASTRDLGRAENVRSADLRASA